MKNDSCDLHEVRKILREIEESTYCLCQTFLRDIWLGIPFRVLTVLIFDSLIHLGKITAFSWLHLHRIESHYNNRSDEIA